MDAIICAGQSNMAGGITMSELPDSCRFWPDSVTLCGPDGPCSLLDQEKGGPELGLAHQWAELHPDEPVVLIKYALGASNLANQWSADGSYRIQEDLHKTNDCWPKLQQALHSAETSIGPLRYRGFIWMQGERDSVFRSMADAYEAHLIELLQRVRSVSNTPDLPAVIGRVTPRQMTEDGRSHRHAHRNTVRAAQMAVAEADAHACWVDSDDLPQRPDNLHFITAGSLALGRRFADALDSLQ